jgi:hypothetical protein
MMNTLQQKMQDLNQMFANTCNTAKCIMDDGCSTEGLGNLACLYSTGFSNDSDYAKCKDEAKAAGARADVAARAEANKAAGEGIDFLMGNLTYDMIGKSSPDLDAKLAGFASLFNLGSMTPKELVISMIGTVIVDESGKAETKLLPLIGFPELFENKGDETDPTGLTSKYYQCGAAQEHSLVTYECMTMESKDISRTVTNVDKLITDSLDDLISALEAFDAATLDGLQPMPRYLLNFIEPHLINAIVLTGKEKTNQVLATDLIKQKKLYIAAAVKDDFSNAVINVIKTLLVKGHQNRLTTTGVEILNQRLKELVAQRNKFREDNKDAFKFIEKTQSWHTLKRLYTSSLATKISDIMSKE